MGARTTPINEARDMSRIPVAMHAWAAGRVGALDLKEAGLSSQHPTVYTLIDIDSHKALRGGWKDAEPVAGWWNSQHHYFESSDGSRTDAYGQPVK